MHNFYDKHHLPGSGCLLSNYVFYCFTIFTAFIPFNPKHYSHLFCKHSEFHVQVMIIQMHQMMYIIKKIIELATSLTKTVQHEVMKVCVTSLEIYRMK